MLLSYSLDIRRVNLFPVVTYVSYAMSVTLCQLRYVSYVMFLFNPNVTYLEYNLSPLQATTMDHLDVGWLLDDIQQ